MSEAQQLQNDMGTKLVRDTARATVAEARLATDIAIRTSLEEQLRLLHCSYTPLTNRDQQFLTEFPDTSTHSVNNDFQGPFS